MSEYAIAPLYDVLLWPFVHSLRLKVLRHCKKMRYSSILDVCCGTGNQLKILKKHGFNVTGVDLNPDMLQVSRQGRYVPDCRFEDASRMSFPSGSFDAAMTTFALHEKENQVAQAIIEEMVRVVRPGGRIILIDFHFTSRSSRISKGVIKLIEWNAGGDHYRHFLEFIRSGGIIPLIEGFPLGIESVEYAGMGSVGIFVFGNQIPFQDHLTDNSLNT